MSDYASKSWWLASLPTPIVANPPLVGNQRADVTIIGGGYTGLSVAYHLKRLDAGIDVRVIEADVCGYGASGRNGGFSMA
ncbi:MAG: FAD-dependent oxidoreductase, partial [Desulfobacteraceae bacterium]|nr:FAD-dependent oxidoreductase [Desulfobacteraceae bacterium]